MNYKSSPKTPPGSWFDKLNPEQAEAVQHREGPLLILAGAGSGKTTVLVSRCGYLIESGVKASSLAVLTFTNKAARELKHRVHLKLGDHAKGLWAGTFHSFGLGLLKKHARKVGLPAQFGIVDQSDSQAIVKDLLRQLVVAGKDKFDLEMLLGLIHEFRLHGQFRTAATDEYKEVAEVLGPRYLKRLESLGVVDFEGLLLKPLELMREHPDVKADLRKQLRFLMVDEFQDTNATQMNLIDEIMNEERNLAVVGDDDQSIYGWRGAEVSHILDFPKRYKGCKVIRLERNYRSTGPILALANNVIAQNTHRHGKVLRTQKQTGSGDKPEIFVYENEDQEAESVVREIREQRGAGRKFGDLAVLYRSNSQSAVIETLLRQNQIPYSVSGGTSMFERKEIKDLLAYLRFSLHGSDLSLRRILNLPPRGVGDTTFERIEKFAQEKRQTFASAARQVGQIEGVAANTATTISDFLTLAGTLAERVAPKGERPAAHAPGGEFLKFFEEIGYRKYLYETSSEAQAGEKKWNLIEIFSRILEQDVLKNGGNQKALENFLDRMELRDADDDEKKDEVSLMTLHASKGLEFPVVFLVGVEEDLLPHRTLGSNVDEERRLFYVGVTRAQERLLLSYCKTRRRFGAIRPVAISRFLHEISPGLVTTFAEGVRPWTATNREQKLAEFFKKFDKSP